MTDPIEEWFCGCCGNPCGEGRTWCVRCSASPKHLGAPGLQPWHRTYQSTHGKPCPHQVDGLLLRHVDAS